MGTWFRRSENFKVVNGASLLTANARTAGPTGSLPAVPGVRIMHGRSYLIMQTKLRRKMQSMRAQPATRKITTIHARQLDIPTHSYECGKL